MWMAADSPIDAKARTKIATANQPRHRRIYPEPFCFPGLREVSVSSEIARLAGNLPDAFAGDSADRVIFATASLFGLPLATRDKRIQRFAKAHGSATCIPV
ncbi:MAG: PIN domain-containing protein [Candidatus Eremiobacteraeota bacterium]|nr:PIN domain-containing protein [Candidatus Eremiobacteraeota bacterium]